jgi:2-amino-4-hydroxy-6-hydroxymethyldihydropteridine diphosphokinase
MRKAFLHTGSNRGSRLEMLHEAHRQIGEKTGEILLASSVYETEPWGFHDETPFLNQVLEIKTDLSPEILLQSILEIETVMGRKREFKGYLSRKIDIDILFYDDLVICTENLVIPHPRMHERRFVLIPLAEIAKDFIHPVFHRSIEELLVSCSDQSRVEVWHTSD